MINKLNKVYVSSIKTEEDKECAIKVVDLVFKSYGGYSVIAGSVDFKKSYILKKGYEIIGTYLLGNHDIFFNSFGILNHYNNKNGLEGVALCIHPDYRGLGYGRMLKEYPANNIKVDYIWGIQLASLDNLENWANKRRLVYNRDGLYVTLQDIKDTFPHTYQTTCLNCGATSLKILLMYYGSYSHLSIDELSDVMEIDAEFGTTDVRMKIGLNRVNLTYEQIKVDDSNAILYLKNYIKNDRKVLLRTLINGIKHWVVVYDYNDGMFSISDPAFGKYKYSESEVYDIWKPRNFDGFIVYGKTPLYKINEIKEIYNG